MLLTAATDLKPVLSFSLASIALLASPGPATVALAASGASFGLRRSLKFYFGIVVGLIPAIALVAGGVFVALRAVPVVSSVLFAVSVAYILYLAVKIASAPPLSDPEEVASPGFLSGFILGITNVKAYAVFAALFGGFALGISDQWDVLIKAAICMAVIVVFDFLWLATGSNLRHFFTNPVLSRIVNTGLAALMLVMVVWSVWRS
ncbi:LysE family translocator [Burkholderia pseudomultivorans]|uniref:Cysteine/O-acetylserine efflux protein n=1 Tax=Burkholderia pseudomultivorans TaxID=1207504 RepID=A0ABU2E1F6_9BURK|nr:LysE family translocator [Burkholderia pseudomultivorans]MDR8728306.1 Cysteine/O-acetylserine efflux protein [Burkholderia pseudomultivorans]MDR8735274.1 Cysteine/O-acetylserine efflux protein [Burkholderia pseudomultivorans]MDR8741350.1 Cysteine/O-acetylserine efflux protein [Burkholderia pseudomultivorans]MDR8753696.1 Cysteine/O-acetylserine efflux protein [Burkholderia pseudomultivorans]MDR8777764.1 Cysteine/O-acetylserine efflux protein [Burkholderia pseudomultivorans]